VSPDQIISYVFGSGTLLAGIAALIGARTSRRVGVSGDEREARRDEAAHRRDTIADRDALIDQMQEQLRDLVPRVERIESELNDERDYTRLLVDHIYRQAPPPPPARPARST